MNTIKEHAHLMPQQTIFDMDLRKFLIDSSASVHMWNTKQDFIYYRELDKEEQEHEQVLGVMDPSPNQKGLVQFKSKSTMTSIKYMP